MKRRGMILVTLSLVLGLAAAWGANRWVQGRLAEDVADTDSVRVVAAALSIPYGTKVQERQLRWISLEPQDVPEAAVTELAEAEGKVATVDIEPGELLLSTRLADHAGGSTLAALVKESMRAITIRVDDVVGVAGFLLPGNYVDVVSSRMDVKTRRAVTETVLNNLKVLAVDQTASADSSEPVIVRAVTLEVTPAQSEVLVKAKQEGAIQLTLRNPREVHVAEAPKVEKKKAAPVSAPPPPTRRWTPSSTEVEIIRGTRIDKTKAKI